MTEVTTHIYKFSLFFFCFVNKVNEENGSVAKSTLSSLMTEFHPWDPNTARKFPGVVF